MDPIVVLSVINLLVAGLYLYDRYCVHKEKQRQDRIAHGLIQTGVGYLVGLCVSYYIGLLNPRRRPFEDMYNTFPPARKNARRSAHENMHNESTSDWFNPDVLDELFRPPGTTADDTKPAKKSVPKHEDSDIELKPIRTTI
jgi:hypothetical protein